MSFSLLQNSLLVSGAATLLAVGYGLAAALWLAGLEARWRSRVLLLSVAALALPPFLVTNCWLQFLGNAGSWRGWLPLNIFSLGGAAWILSLLLWPIPLLSLWSAWQRIEPAQMEVDPALRGWMLIRHLLLPSAWTALAQASVLTLVLALNNFTVPAILQVKVFPAEMWVRFSTNFDTLGALLLCLPLVAGPLALFWLVRRESSWPRLEGAVPPALFRRQLGAGWFKACGLVTALVVYLSVGLPALQLAGVERTWTELPGAVAAGQGAIWNSAWFAAVSATLVVLGALGLSLRFAGTSAGAAESRTTGWALPLWLLFLLPGVFLGVALIFLFNRPGLSAFYQSAGIVILAYVLRYLAPGWTAVRHALQSADRELVDAARLDGANRWQLLRLVLWPQIARPVAAAWYILFLLCLWDVESMILISPPGEETLALRIFNLLHYGHNAQLNALCLVLLVVALAPLLLWKTWHRLRGPGGRTSRTTAWLACACAAIVPWLTGCGSGSVPGVAELKSSLFARARVIGSRGVGVGELNKPRSVTVDLSNNVYAVDMTGRVQKFAPDGHFLLSWQMPQTDLGRPKGLGRDRDGSIIVVEPHYQRVNYFTTDGRLLAQWGRKGTNAGQLMMPRSVAVDSLGEVFLCEYGEVERVQVFGFDRTGLPPRTTNAPVHLLRVFGQPGTGPGEFNRAEGVFMDSHDRLYVADSCNHRIQVFKADGTFIRCYGKPGSGKGELSYPYDICVDKAGRQYVCEFGNSRIQVFDANDQPIDIIGGPGSAPGQFNNPWGIALDAEGNLYVADSQNHRVQKIERRREAAGGRRSVGVAQTFQSAVPQAFQPALRGENPMMADWFDVIDFRKPQNNPRYDCCRVRKADRNVCATPSAFSLS
jgi:ABC-type Fe3+ transport system permease subunit/DNA-binding beta-propeller fold protein YncE